MARVAVFLDVDGVLLDPQRTSAAWERLIGEVLTASGNPSWRLEPLLERWGVRRLVGVAAGADLVRVMKDTDAFYPGVLALAGVAAAEAIVVDDDPAMLDRARALGIRTVLVAAGKATASRVHTVIASIEDLPDALARIARENSRSSDEAE